MANTHILFPCLLLTCICWIHKCDKRPVLHIFLLTSSGRLNQSKLQNTPEREFHLWMISHLLCCYKSIYSSNVRLKWRNKTVVNHTKKPVKQHVYTQCKRFEIWLNASAIIKQQLAWMCTCIFTYSSKLKHAPKHHCFPVFVQIFMDTQYIT